MKIVDGCVYNDDEVIHDLGSFECVGVSDGNVRSYEGLSGDVDKLPTYANLGAGSSAMCLDTGDYYKYHAKTRTWYKM